MVNNAVKFLRKKNGG